MILAMYFIVKKSDLIDTMNRKTEGSCKKMFYYDFQLFISGSMQVKGEKINTRFWKEGSAVRSALRHTVPVEVLSLDSFSREGSLQLQLTRAQGDPLPSAGI